MSLIEKEGVGLLLCRTIHYYFRQDGSRLPKVKNQSSNAV